MPDIIDAVFDMHKQHDAGYDERNDADGAEAEVEGAFKTLRKEIGNDIASHRRNKLVDARDDFCNVSFFVKCNNQAAADDHERNQGEHCRIGGTGNTGKQA